MRTAMIALATIALLTAPAYARGGGKGKQSTGQSEEQKQKAAQADKAYKAAVDSIPNQPKADPWGGMRK
jgi:hypothetical protein